MLTITGQLLHKKEFKSSKGQVFPVVSILDDHTKYTQVLDVTDFDNVCQKIPLGATVRCGVNCRANLSKNGGVFINYAIDGQPQTVETVK